MQSVHLSDHEKTVYKPKLRVILQSKWPLFFRSAKVQKTKLVHKRQTVKTKRLSQFRDSGELTTKCNMKSQIGSGTEKGH